MPPSDSAHNQELQEEKQISVVLYAFGLDQKSS